MTMKQLLDNLHLVLVPIIALLEQSKLKNHWELISYFMWANQATSNVVKFKKITKHASLSKFRSNPLKKESLEEYIIH
jgi:hypothetical protein